MAGLGEKKIFVPNVECSAKEFNEIIIKSFPRLENAGGFEFLKCTPSTRKLEVIPFSVSSSPRRLKAWIGTAKLYLRPIQVDLDLEPTDEFISSDEVIVILIHA